jgi:hypothetical protein
MTQKSEEQNISDQIERKQAERASLIREHGHGCRPSWVSADLAVIGAHIAMWENALTEELERQKAAELECGQ